MLRQRPLSIVAAGLTLVALDLRIVALDVLPDALGWALVAAGTIRLGLRVPAIAGALAALASLGHLVLPGGVRLVDPGTGRVVERCPPNQVLELPCYEAVRFDPVTGWRLALLAVAVVAGAIALTTFLLALRARAAAVVAEGAGGAPEAAAAIPRLGLLVGAIGLWAAPQLAGMAWAQLIGGAGYDAVWNGLAEYLALAGLVGLAAAALELSRQRGERWALPAGWERTSTWVRP